MSLKHTRNIKNRGSKIKWTAIDYSDGSDYSVRVQAACDKFTGLFIIAGTKERKTNG